MAKKMDSFTRCFDDFVSYLNVVEPFDRQDGFLSCRIGIVTRDTGELTFWMQDLVDLPDAYDGQRYTAVFERLESFVRDLNTCRLFVDEDIAHTFELFDQEGKLRFVVIRHGR